MQNWFKNCFRKRRVFTTFDSAQMAGVCTALRQAGIKIKTEERSDDISIPANGLANLPQVIQTATEYSVYVDQGDLELAEYLVSGGRLD